MSDFRSKSPELLLDLTQHVAHALAELTALDASHAEQVASAVAERMAAHWGGQNIYFPMGLSIRLSRRDRQVYDKFNGHNQSELAREFGVSLQWVYKIIKAVRKEEIARRQVDLFTASSNR
ncbi:Mor transcription activator family protein [Pseudomonas sp. 5P_3.1_Bac2]|uniref:Mor transcription activator family protein n=1 Tax=Pseudomonas sp. 5P_3.1_Bac2 TaxID=2971617 RepID=UPI0021C56869|nr:Mor transcription activator family protein [Pseudomonas sp. 5P_3.1_Bac2]MCU1717439.1 DNA-binding protein [Pseudomonas sp. 5P_3.1_Bac2]